MAFVRLPVNIWRRQCVCNIFLQQSNRTKLPLYYPLACSTATFTDPQFLCLASPLVCPQVPIVMFDSTARPGISPESCLLGVTHCGQATGGEEEAHNTYLAQI